MKPHMDAAACRSNKRVTAERRKFVARQEAAFLSDARRFGHHGTKDLIEIIRQRHNMAITEEYAQDLLARA